MNHVCIISNGPSARLYKPRPDFDAVIGVNKAVSLYACDYWCFVDWITFQRVRPIGTPTLFIKECVPGKIKANDPELFEAFATCKRLYHEHAGMTTTRWNAWSGTAALGLLKMLGVRQATVYGVDMTGDSDCRGDWGNSRIPMRWEQERQVWNTIVAELGITVNTVTETS